MAAFEETLNSIRTTLVKECPKIGLVYHGVATNIIDPQNFYICPLNFYHVLPMLEKPGRNNEDIKEHSIVVYYSPTLSQLARGTIRSMDPNRNCDVFAIDYGVLDMKITPNKIFEMLNEEAGRIPGLAQLCELVMCFPCKGGQFTKENIESFKFFMGQDGEKLTVTIMEKNNQKLVVQIMSSNSNPDDVSAVMHYSKNSVLWSSPP